MVLYVELAHPAPPTNTNFQITFIIFNINFFRRVFSEYTEVITASLIPLETENCAFIIGCSCTVWTKMRSLAGSLNNGYIFVVWQGLFRNYTVPACCYVWLPFLFSSIVGLLALACVQGFSDLLYYHSHPP